jgi:hypothetical protein
MRSTRFACLFLAFSSAILAAQANPVVLINQPVSNKASNGLPKPGPKTQAKILEGYGNCRSALKRIRARRSCQRPTLSCS